MSRIRNLRRTVAIIAAGGASLALTATSMVSASADGPGGGRPAVPPGAIKHVIVIDLENEDFGTTFGANSPATYLNKTLVPQGELLTNYYATGHVSLDNYAAQVSGQAPNLISSSDCITDVTNGAGTYNDVVPGTLDKNQAAYPGQVDGQGCVYPSSVQTIGDQLDASQRFGDANSSGQGVDWREYAQDMGNDPKRDGGQSDPLGGTDCAHPTQSGGTAYDDTNAGEGPNAHPGTGQVKSTVTDQYADRHNPFIYFHSVTGDTAACDAHVVPLGTAATTAAGTTFSGHLAQDLAQESTTPQFAFITPNVCSDGHDSACAGTNQDGTSTGGLVGADAFLRTWMPLILNAPAYRDGSTLVVVTFDEGSPADATAGDGEKPGPNSANPGYSPLLNYPVAAFGGKTYYQLLGVNNLTANQEPPAGTMPGGGRVGAVLFNPKWINSGSVNTTSYNHYSALRSYEDLLGIRSGGADGEGHLGFAATSTAFGPDVFNAHHS